MYPGLFIFRQALANGSGGPNKRCLAQVREIAALGRGQFGNGRLLCCGDRTIIDEGSAADTIVITTNLVTMLLEDGELVLNGRDIPANIARVSVLCDQPEGNLFPSPSDQ